MKNKIQQIIESYGFVLVGFNNREEAKVDDYFSPWIAAGNHGEMNWFKQHLDIRLDPGRIEPWVQSIISLGFAYKTSPPKGWKKNNPISCFAWGRDYHKVLKKKMKQIIRQIKELEPSFQGRCLVDSAPLPEKPLAQKAGLGWIGKNGLLINPTYGSYIFLGEIVCNLNLSGSFEVKNQCGECDLCIKLCPTQAILEGGRIDARRCISYLTIEKAGDFNPEEARMLSGKIFGCDICQQVCPWNRQSKPEQDSPFQCFSRWLNQDNIDFKYMGQNAFAEITEGSPLRRAGLDRIRRNALANKKK